MGRRLLWSDRSGARLVRYARMATTYALFVRGINVGTKNSLPMVELVQLLEQAGASGVRTYVQSGNAVFESKLGEAALIEKCQALLTARMGRSIAVTVRSAEDIARIATKNPWPKVATDGAKLAVTFLSTPLEKSELAALALVTSLPEQLTTKEREIYTWHPNGLGKSPLAAAITKLARAGAVTTRNWNTVQKVAAMCGGA